MFTKLILLIAFSLTVSVSSFAQDWKTDKKINVLFGLSQPILAKGFNIEGNFIYNRFIFDYSHGVSLDYSGNTVTTDLKRQGVAVHIPWTTGFGIGYRVKEWINIRVEPKWHRFEYYYEGESQNNGNQIISYNTMSLGIGIYGNYQPFKNKSSSLRGFTIAPSIRYWPTIASTLTGDKFSYSNKNTLANEEIKTQDPGINATPWVFNVSIGYSFDIRKHK